MVAPTEQPIGVVAASWPAPSRETAAISSVPYLPGLDGLRALAVAAVIVYHANNTWLPGGFLGVEVFFVISGYLITLLLVSERERSGHVALGAFWARRARRLLPALALTLFLVAVYTALFRSDAAGQLRGDLAAGTLYVSNWYQIWVGAGYTAAGDFAPLRHLWSLAVEEQFYLLWPLVMLLLLRRGTRRVADAARWLAVGALVVTIAMAIAVPSGPLGTCTTTPDAFWTIGSHCISKVDGLYLGTFSRAGGLLLGSAFALVWRPDAIARGPLRRRGVLVDLFALGGLVALVGLVLSLHVVTEDGRGDPYLFRGGFLLTSLATLALVAAVTHRGARAGKLLGTRALREIGLRSYGLYLFHWPVFQMFRRVAGRPLTVREFATAMVVTAVITELSFRLIEGPVRRRTFVRGVRNWLGSDVVARRRTAVACIAVVAFLGAGSALAIARAPLQSNEIAESLAEGSEFVVDPLAPPAGSVPASAATTVVTTGSTSPPSTAAPEIATTVAAVPEATVAAPPAETAAPETTAPAAPPPETAPPETAAAVAPAETVAPETTPPPTFPPYIPRYALGDSVMLGAAEQLSGIGFLVDAAVSRTFTEGLDRARQLVAEGRLGEVVLVHLGTNGRFSGSSLAALLDTLSAVPRVVVVNLRADRSWIPGNNEQIAAVVPAYPNVVLVDWATASAACPGNCFYDDGIHLRPDGRRYYTDLVAQAMG